MKKRIIDIISILFIYVALIFVQSCSNTLDSTDDITLTITLSNSSPNYANSSNSVARTAAGDQYIGNFSLYNDAFDSLGDQVDFSGSLTLTPTSLIMPFNNVGLGSQNNDILIGVPLENYPESEWEDRLNIDICDPISFEVQSTIIPDVYDTLYFGFQYVSGWLGEIPIHPFLEVTVPGYTNNEWPDQISTGTITNAGVEMEYEFIFRKYLGENKFQFRLDQLFPKIRDSSYNSVDYIENFMFCSDYSEPGVILTGLEGFPDYVDTTDYGNITCLSSTGSTGSIFLLPFEGINIQENMTLTFYVETEGLLTVYDNGTPDNKNDDKLMFVKDFYNHFGMEAISN